MHVIKIERRARGYFAVCQCQWDSVVHHPTRLRAWNHGQIHRIERMLDLLDFDGAQRVASEPEPTNEE